MWNIKEEDLDEFKITCRHRLSPEGAMLFIFVALIRFGWDYYLTLFDTVIVRMELLLYSLQVIFFIIYLIPKVRFKFQKLQTLVILLYAFQLGTIGLTAFVLPGMSNYSINFITLIYVGLLVLGAILVHGVTTVDTFKQASKGAFSMGERSTSFFNKAKKNVMFGVVIYILILLVLIYILILLVLIYIQNNYSLSIMFGYFIFTFIMYAVAIGAAEFQLLAYCRFKFPSFYISWEEHEKERQKRLKLYEEQEKKQAKEIK
ncbi:hypothetical protein ACFVUU_07455 [Bacillus thuringiensis]|uniref:hypothetical protein n=1 Tax=Bacillus thuringiensis TaxID=1428 RepID=UPI0036EB1049